MWRAISGYTDFPRVVVRTSGNINFTVRSGTQVQSVYPDIALHISGYCVYSIEDQNLTHTI